MTAKANAKQLVVLTLVVAVSLVTLFSRKVRSTTGALPASTSPRSR